MRETPLKNYVPIADAIASLLAPHAEVVLHDLLKGTIVHIANCFSKRRRGDSSLTDLAKVNLRQAVIGPYSKTNWNGRRLKSVSAVIHDRSSKPIGLLCINQDIEAFSQAAEHLSALVSMPVRADPATSIFPGDWREAINERITAFLNERSSTVAGMLADDVNALIADLDRTRVFEIRHTVNYVASVLDISRATLYQRLKRIRAGTRRPPRKGTSNVKTKT